MAQVLALVDDLFFRAKLLETARQVGVELKTCATREMLLAEVEKEPAKLVIVDLNARQDPLPTIELLRASRAHLPIVAYLSHVQVELAERAREAGCQEVLPRSKLTRNLATILAQVKSYAC